MLRAKIKVRNQEDISQGGSSWGWWEDLQIAPVKRPRAFKTRKNLTYDTEQAAVMPIHGIAPAVH